MSVRRTAVLVALGAAGTAFGLWAATVASAATPHWTVEPVGSVSDLVLAGVSADADADVYAVGTARPAGGLQAEAVILHRDAHGWHRELLHAVPGGHLSAVSARTATDVWAVGSRMVDGLETPLVEHGTGGGRWQVVPTPVLPAASSLTGVSARTANDVWAVGVSQGDYGPHPLVEHFDGTGWHVVPAAEDAGNDGNPLYAVVAVAANDVWAVGGQEKGFVHPLVEHWDGHAWHIVPVPDLAPGVADDSSLHGVTALSARDVWAVGGGGLILHWNGTAWTSVPSHVPHVPHVDPADGLTLAGVAGHGAKDLWAVGYTAFGAHARTLTVHWNGTRWTVVPGPNPGSTGDALAAVTRTPGGRAVAVGWQASGGPQLPLIARTG